jgi:hypothetical protein
MMAQGGGGGGMRMTSDQRVAAVDKAVSLTDDQKIKIKAIYEADMKKMQDLMAAQDPDARTKMMAIRTDENAQIKALLTDEQKPKYDAYLASLPQPRCRSGDLAAGLRVELAHHHHLLLRLHSSFWSGFGRRAGESFNSPAFLRVGRLHGARATGTMMRVSVPVSVAMRGAELRRNKKGSNEE